MPFLESLNSESSENAIKNLDFFFWLGVPSQKKFMTCEIFVFFCENIEFLPCWRWFVEGCGRVVGVLWGDLNGFVSV